jgi:hypothetical protein
LQKKEKDMKKIVSAALLALVCGYGTTLAAENYQDGPNPKKFSLGYEGVFAGDVLQGLSTRYWFNQNVGGELNFYYGKVGVTSNVTAPVVGKVDGDASLLYGSAKILFAPVVKQNSRFYLGLEGGIGSVDANWGGYNLPGDITVYSVSPLIGSEFRFTEISDLCFNWEVGYRFQRAKWTNDPTEVKVNVDGTFVSLGAHYYF